MVLVVVWHFGFFVDTDFVFVDSLSTRAQSCGVKIVTGQGDFSCGCANIC